MPTHPSTTRRAANLRRCLSLAKLVVLGLLLAACAGGQSPEVGPEAIPAPDPGPVPDGGPAPDGPVIPDGGSMPDAPEPPLVAMQWEQLSPLAAPSARYQHAMVFDAKRGEVVLFGGRNNDGVLLNDTWVWNGTTWTQKMPATSPPARQDITHAMAYDAAREVVVLFGGYKQPSNLGDTWTWNGATWTQQQPADAPAARSGHALAYDAARQEVVLYGGNGNNSPGDTWVWNGTAWTEKSPAQLPGGLVDATLTYDAVREEVVLFGGHSSILFHAMEDTWVWNGISWNLKNPSVLPPRRRSHSAAYDAARQRVVVFAGIGQSASPADTWTWGGITWTAQPPATAPTARYNAPMAYDEIREQVVLFGGAPSSFTGGLFSDTWVWRPVTD